MVRNNLNMQGFGTKLKQDSMLLQIATVIAWNFILELASHNDMSRVNILSMSLHLASLYLHIIFVSIANTIQVIGIDKNKT